MPPMAFNVIPPFGLHNEVAFEIEVGAVESCDTDTLKVGPLVSVVQGALSVRLTQYVVFVVGLTVMVLLVSPVMILFPIEPVPH